MDCMEKYDQLLANIRQYDRICVAYSGGADSTLLLKAAADALPKEDVIAVIADTDFFTREEIEDAKDIAAPLTENFFKTDVELLQIPQIAHNESNRCYHCKRIIFSSIAKVAYHHGIKTIADGTILEDIDSYRPGLTALRELGIISPLNACGITKKDVRGISEKLGLKTWDKPTNSCLATRFPYDTEITREKLDMVKAAEGVMNDLGIGLIRVRTHGEFARIEVEKEDFEKLLGRQDVIGRLKELGYRYVTLDLEGFRTGSMDHEEG